MDLRPTCMQCHCAMDMATIRANSEGGFICRTCLEAKTGGLRSPNHSQNSSVAKEIFSKKSYLCEDCGYSFERNATFIVSSCPMCAKADVHEVMIDKPEVAVEEETDEIIFS